MNFITWLALLIMIWTVYKKQQIKPEIWKMLIVVFVGLFSFSINISVMEQQVKLAILPLGVWIIYWIYSRRNEGRSWNRYRQYAWIGFIANYFFLLMSLLIIFIHGWIYPKDEISTYISDLHDSSIIKIHPTGQNVSLDQGALLSQLKEATRKPVYSEKWYYETYVNVENKTKTDERFPYQLTGVRPKQGSGISFMIFIEQNGKGILISHGQEQLYFRLDAPILKEAR
ncbi:hypothetical protein V7654_15490 [Bacillus sp. JJ1609]|uniref:hypothetical protein n=1 Tax=Bacillus sp. JJ1609 TaxID=3122977 RepID=UPI003000BE7F